MRIRIYCKEGWNLTTVITQCWGSKSILAKGPDNNFSEYTGHILMKLVHNDWSPIVADQNLLYCPRTPSMDKIFRRYISCVEQVSSRLSTIYIYFDTLSSDWFIRSSLCPAGNYPCFYRSNQNTSAHLYLTSHIEVNITSWLALVPFDIGSPIKNYFKHNYVD